jgi:hypothetical protein
MSLSIAHLAHSKHKGGQTTSEVRL